MIIVISRFNVGTRSLDEVTAMFRESVPRYQAVKGLLSKHYYVDGSDGGGVYLFQNMSQVEALFTEAWRQTITQRFGSAPNLTYLPCTVSIDNASGRVICG